MTKIVSRGSPGRALLREAAQRVLGPGHRGPGASRATGRCSSASASASTGTATHRCWSSTRSRSSPRARGAAGGAADARRCAPLSRRSPCSRAASCRSARWRRQPRSTRRRRGRWPTAPPAPAPARPPSLPRRSVPGAAGRDNPARGRHARLHPRLERGGLAPRGARRRRRELPDVDVLVIDDGSTDATAEVAQRGRRAGRRASPRTAGCARASPRATGAPPTAATTSAAGSTPTASTPPPSWRACSCWCGRASATWRSARASCPSPGERTGPRPSASSAPRCCAC